MTDFVEITGKSVEDAFMNAIIQLETTSDNIEYEVIDKGSSGILGFGTRPAKIKARVKNQNQDDVEEEYIDRTEDEEDFTFEEKSNKADQEQKPEAAGVIKNADKADNTNVENETVKHADAVKADKKASVANCDVDKIIRDFLGSIFKAMNMEVNIDIDIDEEGCVNVELSGSEMGLLIGKRGQTLDSIQYLVSLVVNKENEKYMRVKLDTENYRQRRKETLESLAKNIAYKVKRSRRSVSLEPMNPYERRIIHSTLQNDRFVATRSEGEEPFRHVIVYLKNDYHAAGHDNYKKDYNKND